MRYKIGDKVSHVEFGQGVVVRLNMSGPVVKFERFIDEMCCPESSLTLESSLLLNKFGIFKTPWKVSGYYNNIVVSEDEKMIVADCTTNHYKERHKPQHTRLMAAAPEMLEALIFLMVDLEHQLNPLKLPSIEPETIYTIIEKATGKTWGEIKELLDER